MSDELFREYDGLVGLTFLNLYTLSKSRGQIELGNFNRKNKEHLYLLRVAQLVRAMHKMPIYIQCSIWDWIWINIKECKGFDKVKRLSNAFQPNIYTQEVLNFMRNDGIARCGANFNFGDIYATYYERKKS